MHDDEFLEHVAQNCADAVVDLWIVMVESLAASGVINPELIPGVLKRVLDQVAATRPNSIGLYVLQNAYKAYSDPDPNNPTKLRPTWFGGVVDGGKDQE